MFLLIVLLLWICFVVIVSLYYIICVIKFGLPSSFQFVDSVLYPLSPLFGSLALVESLPWYGFAESYRERLALILVHLVWQVDHGYVYLQMQSLAPSCYAVELVRVASGEMDWDNVALVLHGLADKSLFPFQIFDDSVFTHARA